MAKRIKLMPKSQFEDVMKRSWRPVQLTGDAIPELLDSIPEERIQSIVASGTLPPGIEYSGDAVPSGEIIGGIDVYRYAPDDQVELNKDWYAIVTVSGEDTMLLVSGPHRDDDHWLDEIPERLRGAEILGVPRKHCQ